MPAYTEPLLDVKEINKIYSNNVIANDHVNLTVKKGSVHVILGENGAGKTTLMNILFGMIQPDSGEITFKGKKRKFLTTADAIHAGIGMIHQHFKLVPSLSVLENCFLGIEPKRFFFTNRQKMKQQLEDFLILYNIPLPIDISTEACSTSQQQMIEIVKTLTRGADLIIMDEPTALLTPQERDRLFNIINTLKKDGRTLILITHKINEALMIGDYITLMSEGKVLETFEKATTALTSEDLLKRLYKDISKELNHSRNNCHSEEEMLSFQEISLIRNNKNILNNLHFSAKRGEILGFAGIAGSGQQEIINIITGYEQGYSGRVKIHGRAANNYSPRKARRMNISYIPSDRLLLGSDENLLLWENIISTQIGSNWTGNLLKIKKKKIIKHTCNLMKTFNIKAQTPFVQLKELSGGNIQKTIVARELSETSEIIVADNPTRGIDPLATSFIRNRLHQEKNNGKAILLFSNDFDELMDLCDRIIIVYKGRLIKEFDEVVSLNEVVLGTWMLGRDGSFSA